MTSDIAGSSPRMRGAVNWEVVAGAAARIIPAHAGSSARADVQVAARGDHPRACGEQVPAPGRFLCLLGSSPRMRGAEVQFSAVKCRSGIIPAHAGSSLF